MRDTRDAGNDLTEQLHDASHPPDRLFVGQTLQHRGQIMSVGSENFAGIRGLQFPNHIRVEIVEAHAHKGIIEGPKLGLSRNGDQKQPITGGSGRGTERTLVDFSRSNFVTGGRRGEIAESH